MPFKQFSVIPLQIYPKIYFDLGYANNPWAEHLKEDQLSNQLLRGWGGGLDFFSAYNMTASFEYSFNQLGEGGLFFYWSVDI